MSKNKKSKKRNNVSREKNKKRKERKKPREKKARKKREKRFKKRKIMKIILGLVFLLISIVIAGVYFFPSLSKITTPIANHLFFPLAIVGSNNKLVGSSELAENLQAIKHFYESSDFAEKGWRVDFSTEEGKLRLKIKEREILDKMIENILIEDLAKKNGLSINKKELREEFKKRAQKQGGVKEIKMNLDKFYGWSLEEYQEKVLKYKIYLEKLFNKYQKETKESAGFKKISQAQIDLEKKEEFSSVVKKYSEGLSLEKEGELGWFTKDQLIKPVAEKVFTMKVGEISPIITSALGYHIILLEEKRSTKRGEKEGGKSFNEVKIKQIFVRGKSFADWIVEQKKKFPVKILTNQYTWDKKTGKVEFRDEQMREKEKKIRIKSFGDPSLF